MQKREVTHNHIVHTEFLTEEECDDGDKADVINADIALRRKKMRKEDDNAVDLWEEVANTVDPRKEVANAVELSKEDDNAVEHLDEVQTEEPYLFTPSDFMRETWDPTYTAQRNIRLMIGCISNYLIKQKKINPEARRVYEGEKMKETFLDIYKLWLKGDLIVEHSRREDIMSFLRIHVPINLHHVMFAHCLMTKKNYYEWVQTHKQYLGSLPSMENATAVSGARNSGWTTSVSPTSVDGQSVSTQTREAESEVGVGIEALLRTWTDSSTRTFPQHLTARDRTGQVATMKTSGEFGQQLVRLQVYDTKDIVGRDQKIWWKWAKVRSQFFISSNDRIDYLIGKILEQVGVELKKIPGVTVDVKKYSNE